MIEIAKIDSGAALIYRAEDSEEYPGVLVRPEELAPLALALWTLLPPVNTPPARVGLDELAPRRV